MRQGTPKSVAGSKPATANCHVLLVSGPGGLSTMAVGNRWSVRWGYRPTSLPAAFCESFSLVTRNPGGMTERHYYMIYYRWCTWLTVDLVIAKDTYSWILLFYKSCRFRVAAM